MKELVLASASPRRRQLLEQVGIPYRVCPSKVEEVVTSTVPSSVVEELSAQKCADVLERETEGVVVLGADTVVAFEGQILGKPSDEEDAFRMLQMLQGQTHQVYTGVTLMAKKGGRRFQETFHVCTDVTFYEASGQELREYLAAGEAEDRTGRVWKTDNGHQPEWFDKAGAYGIQGRFAAYVKGIHGDYNNVVGLPAAEVYHRLKAFTRRLESAAYRIRPAREEDLRGVADVEALCFPAAEAAGYEDFVQRFRTCRDSFFVAETEDGQLAGFCNGCCADTDHLADELYHDASLHRPDGPYQMIFGLDVSPRFQKLGIGEALMRHMVESAKKRGKKAVILTCKEHMIPFYKKIGYRYVEVSDSTHGGAVWHKMMYVF